MSKVLTMISRSLKSNEKSDKQTTGHEARRNMASLELKLGVLEAHEQQLTIEKQGQL